MKTPFRIAAALLLIASLDAVAQLGLPGGGIPGLPRIEPRVLDPLRDRAADRVDRLTDPAERRIRRLLRDNRARWEAGPQGLPVVRGEISALSPSSEALARVRRHGFRVFSEQRLESLGYRLILLRTPEGMSTERALRRIRELDPSGSYDYNHIYLGSGSAAAGVAPQRRASDPMATVELTELRIGLVDTAVDLSHPAFGGATVVQTGCDGAVMPGAHGTAVASLLVGNGGTTAALVPGAELQVVDVFCGQAGGSLAALAGALAQLAEVGVPVVNISLAGADSALLAAVVQAVAERGHILVAAVGNDGPAAPPRYPAAYPQVVAVTGVDRHGRVLPEAGRGDHVAFAALGADLRAAQAGGGWGEVRGTSFAAPTVSGLLAVLLNGSAPEQRRNAVEELGGLARDLGTRGPDVVYGRGLVSREAIGTRAASR